MQPKVYFVGASGVGKTTLAKYVHERFGLPLVSSAGQITLDALKLSFNEVLADVEAGDRYQTERLRLQMEAEAPYWESEESGFVSDRSLDVICYTARLARVTWQMTRGKVFQEQIMRMRGLKGGRVITFFVRPHPRIKPPKDGRRDQFLTPAWRYGVDGMMEFILESNEVPFIPVNGYISKDRVRLVDSVLKLAMKK